MADVTVEPISPPRHSWVDDIIGLTAGVMLAAFGLHLLQHLGLITGQLAGVAFLISYGTGVGFGPVFALVNIPFYLFALFRMDLVFTLRSIGAVLCVSALLAVADDWIGLGQVDPLVGSLLAGVCLGIGLLALFRHRASCGGGTILAVYVQDRTGLRAGWLLLAVDVLIFAAAFFIIDAERVVFSFIGTSMLSVLIALNHRSDRYVAR